MQNPNQQFAPQQPMQQPAPAMAFTLDENSAMESGNMPFIDTHGAYPVVINGAVYRQAKTGSHGIKLAFTDASGKTGSVTLYYQNAKGELMFQGHMLNAIMYLAGVGGFNWYQGVDGGGNQITIAKELQGVQIGLVVEPVSFVDDNGQKGSRLELRQVFDIASGRTASEAKEGKAPEAVNKLLAKLA